MSEANTKHLVHCHCDLIFQNFYLKKNQTTIIIFMYFTSTFISLGLMF